MIKSGGKLLSHAKAPNQLKAVTKLAITNLTEGTGDREKTSNLYATPITARN